MTTKDGRDETTWVVYELTHAGERLATEGTLELFLRRILKLDPAHGVFVPYLPLKCGDRTTVFNVMEGYAFVASGLDERAYFAVTNESQYLRSALHTKQGRSQVLLTIGDKKVLELKQRLSEMIAVEIRENMRVEVGQGPFKGLEGIVAGIDENNAHVLITLRTLTTLRTFPRFALLPKG